MGNSTYYIPFLGTQGDIRILRPLRISAVKASVLFLHLNQCFPDVEHETLADGILA